MGDTEGSMHKGVSHAASDPVTQDALKRLRSIEGQVRGIQRMVQQDQYCIDIVTQISAARSALNRVATTILKRHVETCVTESIRAGGEGMNEMIDELMTVLARQEL